MGGCTPRKVLDESLIRAQWPAPSFSNWPHEKVVQWEGKETLGLHSLPITGSERVLFASSEILANWRVCTTFYTSRGLILLKDIPYFFRGYMASLTLPTYWSSCSSVVRNAGIDEAQLSNKILLHHVMLAKDGVLDAWTWCGVFKVQVYM